ncbi:hypothetical protein FA15DRAFT_675666 [Coprinopsis marcescibilis]|uniref:Uncharacterized protein n=1 Tax=Coprinopsis marcescibilis TaxID=230819 RepID=A0A5C3KD36_COPMA|nr:hypothetical protein FA15DRAFT_675666 [Coprinopsis marcescibilis]
MSYPVVYIGLLLACTFAALSGFQHDPQRVVRAAYLIPQFSKGRHASNQVFSWSTDKLPDWKLLRTKTE